jgi:hypothetical protein
MNFVGPASGRTGITQIDARPFSLSCFSFLMMREEGENPYWIRGDRHRQVEQLAKSWIYDLREASISAISATV